MSKVIGNALESFSTEMPEQIIYSVPDTIFIVDRNYIIRRVFNYDPQTLSLPVEAIIGLAVYSAVDKNCVDEIVEAIDRALLSDEVQEVVYTMTGPDSTQYFEGRFKRMQEGLVTCFERNITKRKVAEELRVARKIAETSDRLKSSFISNINHEIRTPLNAIVGFSELISVVEDTQEKAEFVSIIKHNNQLLLRLFNDILDLSEIEADSLDFVYSDVRVNDLFNDLKMRLLDVKISADTGVRLSFISPIKDCVIHTERNRLQQVLINMINNAFKFTAEGEIKVGYELSGETIRFYVQDTGKGIPADKRDEIFKRFVKLDNFISGTGLGLSVCQTIIHKLGGMIGVDSTEGVGSTFWFTLPVARIASMSGHAAC